MLFMSRSATFVPTAGRTFRTCFFNSGSLTSDRTSRLGAGVRIPLTPNTNNCRTPVTPTAVLQHPKTPSRGMPDPTSLPVDSLRLRKPSSDKSPSPILGDDDDDDLCFVDECEETYRLPPPEIARLVDANADPSVSLQPKKKEWMIFLDRPNLPPIAEVAAEELRLAGFRINGNTYAPSRSDYYIGMSLQRVDDEECKRFPISGLPPPPHLSPFVQIGYLRWSPDGSRFAFCIYDPLVGLELWMVRMDTRRAECILPGVRLNAVCADPFTWNSDSRTIIATLVLENETVPKKPSVPRGPVIQENLSSKPAPSRTYQDLLQSRYDRRLFAHYTTCQLGLVDTDECTVRHIGQPAAFRRASPSPDGRFLLVDSMVPPFPYMLPAGRFPRRVEVWDANTGEHACLVAEIPVQDKIPIAFDGVGEGPRSIGWRSDADATLYWAEAQDGGDPNRAAEIRDCVYTLSAPFTDAPHKLASLPWRYSGVLWGSGSVALISERRYKTRSVRSYLIAPGDGQIVEDSKIERQPIGEAICERAHDDNLGEAPKRLIFDIANWEDRYNDPGSVSTVRNERGKTVLRLIYPDGHDEQVGDGETGKPYFMLLGAGASELGDRPFMSLYDTVTEKATRVWQSEPPFFQSVAVVLEEDGKTGTPVKMLIRKEGPKENPNFYVLDIHEKSESALSALRRRSDDKGNWHADGEGKGKGKDVGEHSLGHGWAVTHFPHPAPELIDVSREIVHYDRQDGVRLNASLYLPPGYKAERDGPLPMLMWAYPREYKSAEFAGQTRGSPYQFVRLARTPLYWLARGYAILDGPGMPIIGEGEEEANDTYVEQLVMSAEAAVDYVVKRGVAHRKQIAIGGHSYGAFMTANILAHAPKLFCCGIARSGAYNRTLTPFGFQNEERTLWEAGDVYTTMSPYMVANKIDVPLLLIHGDADNNPGTFPMQSERMFQALKGHGKVCRYVNLPHEGHGYRARESVMHVLAEMTAWLEKYCKGITDERVYMEQAPPTFARVD